MKGACICFCLPSDISGVGSVQESRPVITLILIPSPDLIAKLGFVDIVHSLPNLFKNQDLLKLGSKVPPKPFKNTDGLNGPKYVLCISAVIDDWLLDAQNTAPELEMRIGDFRSIY
jgi:hypothetical protein